MAYNDDQIKQYAYQLQAKGAPSSDIQDFVSKAKAEQQAQPGFVQSVAQGLASVPLKFFQSARTVAEGTGDVLAGGAAKLMGNDQAAQKSFDQAAQVSQPSYNYGYFGSVKTPGAEMKDGKADFTGGLKDIIGTGLQTAPYVLGGFSPAGPGLGGVVVSGAETGALKGAMTGAGSALSRDLGTSDVLKAGVGGAVGGAVAGAATSAAGYGLQKGVGAISSLWHTNGPTLNTAANKAAQDAADRVAADPEGAAAANQALAADHANPLSDVALGVKQSFDDLKGMAQESWKQGMKLAETANPGQTYDVTPKLYDLSDTLGNFNLKLEPVREAGKFTGAYKVVEDGASQLGDKEISAVQGLVDKLSDYGKDASLKDLATLQNKLNAAYYEIPTAADGSPTPYHALIMQLKSPLQEAIGKILPEPLQDANLLYRTYYSAYDNLGKSLFNGDNMKDSASSFLAGLVRNNKGEVLDRVSKGSAPFEGMDLQKASQHVADARLLEKMADRAGQMGEKFVLSPAAKVIGSLLGIGLAGGEGVRISQGKASPTELLLSTLAALTFMRANPNVSGAEGNFATAVTDKAAQAVGGAINRAGAQAGAEAFIK